MKTLKNILLLSVVATLISSCTVTYPFMVTNNSLGTKIGRSKSVVIFSGSHAKTTKLGAYQTHTLYSGILLNKNFGIVEAAKKGGISKIGAVDYKVTSYLFYVTTEFIVAGE